MGVSRMKLTVVDVDEAAKEKKPGRSLEARGIVALVRIRPRRIGAFQASQALRPQGHKARPARAEGCHGDSRWADVNISSSSAYRPRVDLLNVALLLRHFSFASCALVDGVFLFFRFLYPVSSLFAFALPTFPFPREWKSHPVRYAFSGDDIQRSLPRFTAALVSSSPYPYHPRKQSIYPRT